jgi:NAD(P)-dependent dehydrogenase (short-subunit alcohol dehydrogenase family)
MGASFSHRHGDVVQSILISGGNSGIGLQAAREFLARGHRVIILGRDRRKGEEALASFGEARERASFFPVDLSTHAGVRASAERILAVNERFDAVLHTAGVFTTKDVRTADGLHLFFAVNYLSRYHLTQLLLPTLRRTERGCVIMMTSKVPVSTTFDLQLFPRFEPFNLGRMSKPIQIANHHYAAHLSRGEPGLRAGVVNAGGANTDILRMMPWYMRAISPVMVPLFFNSVAESAHNAVEACVRDDWSTPTYWEMPGDFERRTPIVLDESTTRHIVDVSRQITGA